MIITIVLVLVAIVATAPRPFLLSITSTSIFLAVRSPTTSDRDVAAAVSHRRDGYAGATRRGRTRFVAHQARVLFKRVPASLHNAVRILFVI